MHPEALKLIAGLNLIPHPEGGYYKEIYRSDEYIEGSFLPERYSKIKHSFSTSIYFLLEGKQVSKFHKLASDEIWHFQSGTAAVIYIINNNELSIKHIGNQINKGEEFQVVIKRDSWFAAELINKESHILVSCTVSPGFEFADFELAERKKLLAQYPHFHEIINKFT